MGIEDETYETTEVEESGGLSRRGLIVRGGLLAAGLTAFGARGAGVRRGQDDQDRRRHAR